MHTVTTQTHTPTPWKLRGGDPHVIVNQSNQVICKTIDSKFPYDEKKAHARLIAAAPRMLAFIKAGYCDDDEAQAVLAQAEQVQP